MQRLLHVTTGYLRFTVATLLAGTALFFLVGLALTQPRIFTIVACLSVAAFFVVRMEVRSFRHAREISERNKANPHAKSEAEAQVLEFSKALAAAYSPIVFFSRGQAIEAPAPVESLLIGQWNLGPSFKQQLSNSNDATPSKEDEVDLVLKHLETHRKQLAGLGIYPFFVSRAPSQEIIRVMRTRTQARGWGNVVFTHQGAAPREQTISIGFMSTTPRSWPTQLDVLLRDSFQIIRGDVLEVTKS
jgi:hypothetical protein